ncbi:MAG: peroxiredoxin [Halobacteriales archaeon]
MLEPGDSAPDFTLETTEGTFALSDVEGAAVIFFFPKAGSRVCTKEACGFRDELDELKGYDARVLGISSNDGLERLREFAREHDLDYPLASDVDGKVAERYGLGGLLGLGHRMKRATYVVDDGVVVEAIKGLLSSDKHVEGSLEAVEDLG